MYHTILHSYLNKYPQARMVGGMQNDDTESEDPSSDEDETDQESDYDPFYEQRLTIPVGRENLRERERDQRIERERRDTARGVVARHQGESGQQFRDESRPMYALLHRYGIENANELSQLLTEDGISGPITEEQAYEYQREYTPQTRREKIHAIATRPERRA